MKTKITLSVLLIGMFASSAALAQSTGGDKEKNPFKNDPFFSKPIYELLKNPSGDWEKTCNKNIQGYESSLPDVNGEGLDYKGLFTAGPYNASPLYSLFPSLPMIHYNRVDALFLGIRKERMQWYHDNDWLGIPDIQLHGLIGYSTGLSEWQYAIGLEKLLGRNHHFMIGGGYHNATATNDAWRAGLHETTLTAFIAGYDYLDYYKQQGWGAYLLARTDRYFQGGVAYLDDRYTSLNRQTQWALFGSHGNFRLNPPVDFQNGMPVDTTDVSSLVFSVSFNPKRLVISPHFTFSLTAIAEFADPGIGSSGYNYSKYTGELISYINFEPGGVLKYRLRMGSITGDAPRFKKLYLGGIGTLRALPFKALGAGNRMILSNLEIQFGSPIESSDEWIDFDDFYLSLFLDSGWVYSATENGSQNLFDGFDDFAFADLRHNGGIGVGSNLFRCELAWDFNNPERAPVFWVRFNPTF